MKRIDNMGLAVAICAAMLVGRGLETRSAAQQAGALRLLSGPARDGH